MSTTNSAENEIQLLRSSKAGLASEESYVVVRRNTSFLRILGAEPAWELMTATASEDCGGISVCADQSRLIESARRLGAELKTEPAMHKDHLARDYVKICGLVQRDNVSDEEFTNELLAVMKRFFQIYDACANTVPVAK